MAKNLQKLDENWEESRKNKKIQLKKRSSKTDKRNTILTRYAKESQ